MKHQIKKLSWVGSQNAYIDQPDVYQPAEMTVTLGRFGGNSAAGQYKNEDGCLIWTDELEDWEFVMILDAHNSTQSAELVIGQVEKYEAAVTSLLSGNVSVGVFDEIEKKLLELFQKDSFMEACRQVQGETACLIAIRKGKYLYWLSIGDCLLYIFHPELVAFGQYQINQRQFYEWIGQVNTFEQAVPCFSSGVRELRQGENQILLTTDGLVECPGAVFAEPQSIWQQCKEATAADGVASLLSAIQKNHVRDSTTVVSWKINRSERASYASNQ
ncbi:protein phosphatase 2C domain-containing protein [Planococcus sp. CPCC 101016]|uniref:protein phosphatase 2C domain-containing protein n=1 Tax=Planococcus sp. CPCC 101016 TaxID=2599617 RepID=UPI0011B37DC6|nr:protein phosphatase 2C domain-containing protein [Planococcus sp. CPCC 101016]TWT06353.1 protein phosphatase 2C domain-containing protein [Planococcus sp. CPCC 101016]